MSQVISASILFILFSFIRILPVAFGAWGIVEIINDGASFLPVLGVITVIISSFVNVKVTFKE